MKIEITKNAIFATKDLYTKVIATRINDKDGDNYNVRLKLSASNQPYICRMKYNKDQVSVDFFASRNRYAWSKLTPIASFNAESLEQVFSLILSNDFSYLA